MGLTLRKCHQNAYSGRSGTWMCSPESARLLFLNRRHIARTRRPVLTLLCSEGIFNNAFEGWECWFSPRQEHKLSEWERNRRTDEARKEGNVTVLSGTCCTHRCRLTYRPAAKSQCIKMKQPVVSLPISIRAFPPSTDHIHSLRLACCA